MHFDIIIYLVLGEYLKARKSRLYFFNNYLLIKFIVIIFTISLVLIESTNGLIDEMQMNFILKF